MNQLHAFFSQPELGENAIMKLAGALYDHGSGSIHQAHTKDEFISIKDH